MDDPGLPAPPPGGDWPAPAAAGPVGARLRLPGSKSITNRALVLAALADGPSMITGPLRARDTLLMAAALRELGCAIDEGNPDWRVRPGPREGADRDGTSRDGADRDGADRDAADRDGADAAVDVGNAGTVIRFVPPIAALTSGDTVFRGDPRASRRPAGALLDALRQLGARISDDGRGAVPFTVHGHGGIRGGTATLDASGSSQLVSGLLLAAPRFDNGAEIRHEGPPVPSAPHIEMTVAMLRDRGATVDGGSQRRGGSGREGFVSNVWRVYPGRLTPGRIEVEPDLSNSAPFLAAALVTGGSVTIAGWPTASRQPAGLILDLLSQLGASCSLTPSGLTVTGTGRIRGIAADLRDINELTPVLAALAALADSPSVLTGIGHQRLQESDRLAALAGEIGALGGQVTELADGLEIRPRPLRAGPEPFGSHDDHRLVMAAAVLGLAVPGLRVRDAATVGKTFPGFFRLWAQLLRRAP